VSLTRIKPLGPHVTIQENGLWLNRRAKEAIDTAKKPYVLVYWDVRLRKLGLWFFTNPIKSALPNHLYKVSIKPSVYGPAKISCSRLIREWGLHDLALPIGTVSFSIVQEGKKEDDYWVATIPEIPKRRRLGVLRRTS
jgi:hypothetical protein